ncbi:MAG: PorP/SprF family type IX secretion system membrane protein [Saprospiraceae bacterium]|nr:PorP/SprF family type IX secretion system membrane protein [Saprospiraceae bacterium]
MMYRPWLFILLFLNVWWKPIHSQQLPQFTFYQDYHAVLNPAVIHHEYFLYDQNAKAGLAYRQQWTRLKGAPSTALAHGHWITRNDGNAHLITGGYLMQDRLGSTRHTSLYGQLGTVFSRDPYYSGVAGALSIGMNYLGIDMDDIRAADITEIPLDDLQSQWYPDIGIGIFAQKQLNNDDNIYGGISIPQFFSFQGYLNVGNREYRGVRRIPHYYATMGYIKYTSETSYLEPSVWVRYVETTGLHVDGMIRAQLSEEFWLGVGFSTEKTFHFQAGLSLGENINALNNYRFGYAFNQSFSELSSVLGMTHELFMSVAFSTR